MNATSHETARYKNFNLKQMLLNKHMKMLHLNCLMCTLKWVPGIYEHYINWTIVSHFILVKQVQCFGK